jgi:hypothetical protein
MAPSPEESKYSISGGRQESTAPYMFQANQEREGFQVMAGVVRPYSRQKGGREVYPACWSQISADQVWSELHQSRRLPKRLHQRRPGAYRGLNNSRQIHGTSALLVHRRCRKPTGVRSLDDDWPEKDRLFYQSTPSDQSDRNHDWHFRFDKVVQDFWFR